jgi:antitoxin HicB
MKKNLKYYLSLNYPTTVEIEDDDGDIYYSLEIPDLPGCGAADQDLNKAFEKLVDAKELWIEESLKRNLSVPDPVSEEDFSGKFLLRLPVRLHMSLSKMAKREGLSLNQFAKSLLEKSLMVESVLERSVAHQQELLKAINSQTRVIERLNKRVESLETAFDSYFTTRESIHLLTEDSTTSNSWTNFKPTNFVCNKLEEQRDSTAKG